MFDATTPALRRSRPPGRGIASAAAVAVVLLIVLGVGHADRVAAEPSTRDRLDRVKERIERLSDDLTGDRRRFDQLNERAEAARLAEVAIEGRLETGKRRLAQLGEQLDRARAEARRAGRRLTVARERLAERLVAIYESGTSNAVAILLSTRDFGELAAAGAYLEAIAEFERDLAERVAELRLARLDALGEARSSRRSMAEQVVGLRSARASMAEARVSSEEAAARLTVVQREREEKIGQLRGDVEELEAELATDEGASNFAGGPYSIPTYIVMCESGGNYSALNPSSGAGGAYQIIPSTWEAYGGEGLPHLAPKAEQDRIARLIWEDSGPGAWVCA